MSQAGGLGSRTQTHEPPDPPSHGSVRQVLPRSPGTWAELSGVPQGLGLWGFGLGQLRGHPGSGVCQAGTGLHGDRFVQAALRLSAPRRPGQPHLEITSPRTPGHLYNLIFGISSI